MQFPVPACNLFIWLVYSLLKQTDITSFEQHVWGSYMCYHQLREIFFSWVTKTNVSKQLLIVINFHKVVLAKAGVDKIYASYITKFSQS